jgi:hypothetical protein
MHCVALAKHRYAGFLAKQILLLYYYEKKQHIVKYNGSRFPFATTIVSGPSTSKQFKQ